MTRNRWQFVLIFNLAAFACGGLARADNWPQWRGPTNDGICTETGLPAKWSATENVAWSLKMPGMGSSTPIIWGDRIFLTSEDGEEVELLCVSTAGKELWRKKLGSSDHMKRFMGGEGNNSSPSCSTDGRHVYTFTGAGDFTCHDLDGNETWRFNAQERYGNFRIMHGMHTTPLLHGDRLYLSLLHSNGHFLIAIDKGTGKEIWKVERASDARAECEQAYTSPVLWHKGSEEYLVILGNDYCTGHRLEDGSEIWRVRDLNPAPQGRYSPSLRFVATPLATSDLIVIPTAKGGPVVGLKPHAKGQVSAGSPWEQWRRPKDTPDVPAPLIYDGLLYLCREDGQLICMDAKTGKEFYKERTHNFVHRASPVYADGKIYLAAKDGVITVVKPGQKFEVLASNRLTDPASPKPAPPTPPPGGGGRQGGRGRGGNYGADSINASPAISNGRIYVRTYDSLYAIEQKK